MADLGCSPNAAVTFDFLVGKGLRDFQAAAVIGNLELESKLEPTLQAMDTNNLPSRGIAMWQPARWQTLLSFAAAIGRDPWALDTQLEYLWYELTTSPDLGLDALSQSTTLEEAVLAFQNRFERPRADLAHTDRRIGYARGALFACPAIVAPKRKALGIVAAGASVVALVAAAGYGAYKALSWRRA